MTPEQVERRRAHDRDYQVRVYATDPATRERKRSRNAARSETMEGRSKRSDENLRRTWRVRAQRIAEHDGAPTDEARAAAMRADFAAGLTFAD